MMPDGKSQHAKPVRWGLILVTLLAVVVLVVGLLYLYSQNALASLRGMFGSGP